MHPMAEASAPPQHRYQWHEDAENLECYAPGGYHPVHIGDKYHGGRYEVVHKLGFGSYSTVWLARDSEQDRFVALKIIVADASASSSESKILSRLASGDAEHPGRTNVARLVDEFFVAGPNGRHRCIVTDATGCSIAESKECSMTWMFPADVAREITVRVLQALAFTHSCGVVHGDLHANNILFKVPSFEVSSTTEDLYQKIGKPQMLPIQRLDEQPVGPEAPRYCVPPAIIVKSAEEVVDAEVIIADFGEAFICDADTKRTDVTLRTPVLLLPPESIFKEGLGQAIDVWTAGLTIYNILGERPLFEGFVPDEDHALAEMISTLGPLPDRWWRKWSTKGEFFLDDGTWKQDTARCHAPYSRPLSERLRIMGRDEDGEGGGGKFSSRELTALEAFLRSLLTYEPSERIAAAAAQDEAWMVEYGLPAVKRNRAGRH